MPRLPDAPSLGERPIPQSSRPVQGYKAGNDAAMYLAQGAEATGKAFSAFGESAGKMAGSLQEDQDKLDRAYAESAFWTAHATAIYQLKRSNDYRSFGASYEASMKAAIKQASDGFTSNAARSSFVADAEKAIAQHGLTTVNDLARAKEGDQGKASLLDLFEQNRNAYLRAPDDATKTGILLSTQSAINASRDKGYIGADDAVRIGQKFTTDVAEGRLAMLPPEEQIKLLKGMQGSGGGTVTSDAKGAITDAANRHGVDPGTLLTFASLESGFNTAARATTTSAEGLFQFTDATAKQYGLTDKTDASSSSDAAARLLKDNRASLARDLGREPTRAELYLAHQQGAAGAAALLNRPEQNAIDALAPAYGGDRAKAEAAITNNGGKADMTAGAFTDLWQRKVDQASANPTGYAKRGDWTDFIPPEKVPDLLQRAESDHNRQMTAVKERTAYDLSLKIDGAYTSSSLDQLPSAAEITKAVDAGTLSTSQGLSLLDKVATARATIQTNNDALTSVQNALTSGMPVDPKNKTVMAAADSIYRQTVATNGDRTPDELQAVKASFAGRIGAIPDTMAAELRSGLRSGNADQVKQSVDLVARLRSANPRVIEGLTDDDLRFANAVQSKIDAGFDPRQAVTQVTESLQLPDSQLKAREKEYDEKAKASPSQNWVASRVNSLWRVDPDQDAVMLREFDQNAMQEYQRTGDLEGARRTALDQLQRVWGVTGVGSAKRWMKFAPEKFYGVPSMSDADNSAWMNAQLLKDVQANGLFEKPPEARDLIVVPNPARTLPDGRPTYLVSIKGPDGILHNVTRQDGRPQVWVPDWDSSDARKKLADDQQAEIEKARSQRLRLMGNP